MALHFLAAAQFSGVEFLRKAFLYLGLILIGSAMIGFWVAKSRQWPPNEYAEARAYLYNLDGKTQPLVADENLNPTVIDPAGVKLTSEQVQRIAHALMDPRPVRFLSACMFNPRHGVVFYNDQQKPIAWAEICLECQMYQLSSKHKRNAVDWPALRQVFRDAGLPVFENPSDYDALKKKPKSEAKKN